MNAQSKVLIIQLTRIGDLIQTAQATRQFRSENPDTHLTLIARRKFASGILFLLETIFDEIILFDTKDFLISPNLKSATYEIGKFIKKINKREFDFSINLSFSKSSSYLSSLIKCPNKLGLNRNNQGEVLIADKWSQYVYSNVMSSSNNPFSLVDIYRYIMGVTETLVLTPEAHIQKRNQSIVIHPFASQKKKKWGLNKWSELIYKMVKDYPNYTFHIVGSPEDASEAQRLLNSPTLQHLKKQISTHAGKGSIFDTYNLLMNSQLFIGHDSMVSHLAAETLTPSIIISLGSVRYHETSPYNNKVINIIPKNQCFPCKISESCELLPCRNSISYQIVGALSHALLDGKNIDKQFLNENSTPFHLDSAKIISSDYDQNGLTHTELTNDYKVNTEVFQAYYSIIWQYYLRGVETNIQLPQISTETALSLKEYITGVNYLYELYNFGVKYSNKIIKIAESNDVDFKEIQAHINKLNEIDHLCNIAKKSYPLLEGLVDFFYVSKANTQGETLIDISKAHLLNYYDASNLIAVMNDFLEKSIGPHISSPSPEQEV